MKYRVAHKTHLGGTEYVLSEGDIISFDGQTLQNAEGATIPLTQPSGLLGAIRAGWLVPATSKQAAYQPPPSSVQVSSSKGADKNKKTTMQVQAEEREVSHSKMKPATPQGRLAQGKQDGDHVVLATSPFRTAAVNKSVEVGKDDGSIVRKLESQGPVKNVLKKAEDYQESSIKFRTKVSSGSSSTGGEDEGVIIGKVGKGVKALPEDPEYLINALRAWSEDGTTWDGAPARLADLRVMVAALLESVEAAPPEETEELSEEEDFEEEAQEEETFDWDLSPHWKIRATTVIRDFGDDAETLQKILALENSAGVKKAIETRLKELSSQE